MTTRGESIPNVVATLNDVGRAAGVSAMAVSMVLNKPRSTTRISSETRERILAAAAKLNYQPNLAARALADKRVCSRGLPERTP